jgi:hypothetical protein
MSSTTLVMSVIRRVFIVHGGTPTAVLVEQDVEAMVEMRQPKGTNS